MYTNEDGFECFDLGDVESLPVEVKAIFSSKEWEETYTNCAEIIAELEKVGYTAEYYLDAQIFDLRKL